MTGIGNSTSNFWRRSRDELGKSLNLSGYWYHRETLSGTYLPNIYDGYKGTCGAEAQISYARRKKRIVGGRDSKLGKYPFMAAIGISITL